MPETQLQVRERLDEQEGLGGDLRGRVYEFAAEFILDEDYVDVEDRWMYQGSRMADKEQQSEDRNARMRLPVTGG